MPRPPGARGSATPTSPASPTSSSRSCAAAASGSSSRRSTWCRRSTRSGNILLPFDLDGRRPSALERARIDGLDRHARARRPAARTARTSSRGGQQQRVAIARALATAPDLVFADEPTGNLDSRSGREVLGLLAAASREHGQSIAMVTHDPIAASHADRVIFLADGRIVADKPRQSAEEIAAYMLASELGAADQPARRGARHERRRSSRAPADGSPGGRGLRHPPRSPGCASGAWARASWSRRSRRAFGVRAASRRPAYIGAMLRADPYIGDSGTLGVRARAS